LIPLLPPNLPFTPYIPLRHNVSSIGNNQYRKEILTSRAVSNLKFRIRAVLVLLFLCAALMGCGGSSNKFVYTVGQSAQGIFAFKISSSGQLTFITGAPFSTGGRPTAIAIMPSKTFGFVASAGGLTVGGTQTGGVVGYSFTSKTGGLSIANAAVNTGANPVSLAIDPSSQHLYVLSQGSSNISAFSIDSFTGVLTPLNGSPFPTVAAPVSMAMAPSGGALYVVSPTQGISAIAINADGTLGTASAPLPAGTSPRFVTVDPGNHFVYVADSAGNAVLGFSVSGTSLTAMSGSTATGTAPDALAINPDGNLLFVANSGSNNVSVFSIGSGGALTPAQGSPVSTGTAPAFVMTDRSGHLFVADSGSNDLSVFSIGGSGSLTAVSGSPFAVQTSASWIAIVD
jgi:6-phosphogluconolactonase